MQANFRCRIYTTDKNISIVFHIKSFLLTFQVDLAVYRN